MAIDERLHREPAHPFVAPRPVRVVMIVVAAIATLFGLDRRAASS